MNPIEEKVRIEMDLTVHLRDQVQKFAEKQKLTFDQAIEVLLCQQIFQHHMEQFKKQHDIARVFPVSNPSRRSVR